MSGGLSSAIQILSQFEQEWAPAIWADVSTECFYINTWLVEDLVASNPKHHIPNHRFAAW